jgi:hypothetical protein
MGGADVAAKDVGELGIRLQSERIEFGLQSD